MEDHETYSPKEKYRRMFDDAIGQRMGSMAHGCLHRAAGLGNLEQSI